MAAREKLLWSEQYRQAGVVLATLWGLLVTIVIVLALYAYQRDAALVAANDMPVAAPKGAGHVWLDVPPLEAAPLPLAPVVDAPVVDDPVAEPVVEEGAPSLPPQQQARDLPPPAAPPMAAPQPMAPAPVVEPVAEPQPVIESEPVDEPVVELAPAPEPEPEPAPELTSEPTSNVTAKADPAPAPAAPSPPMLVEPKGIFIVLLGGGDNFAVLDVVPGGTAMVLGVIDDNTARYVAKAHENGIQIFLPLPVAQSGPLPSLAAEPDENRKRFAAFLNQLPAVDGLYIPAGHPFNKDMASFAALMEEAKARGLKIIGTLPTNLQTPTTPIPHHHVVDGELLAGDAGNLEGVLLVLVGERDDVVVLTGPAEMAFARALSVLGKDSAAYIFTPPEGF